MDRICGQNDAVMIWGCRRIQEPVSRASAIGTPGEGRLATSGRGRASGVQTALTSGARPRPGGRRSRPRQRWPGFVKMIGDIVTGRLIALGAKQSVEWLQWQQKAGQTATLDDVCHERGELPAHRMVERHSSDPILPSGYINPHARNCTFSRPAKKRIHSAPATSGKRTSTRNPKSLAAAASRAAI